MPTPAATPVAPAVTRSARTVVRAFPDPTVQVPPIEQLATTFGVELEMRPLRVSNLAGGYTHNDPRRLTAMSRWWVEFLEGLKSGGFIDPELEDRFDEFVNNVRVGGRVETQRPNALARFGYCGSSPYWARFCEFLHPQLVAGLNGISDSADAGGDELKSPVLSSSEQTTRFFSHLYTILPHIYDFRDLAGCGMHIHVGRSDNAEQTRRFERFMISREWVFQIMVPQYRRHGYNRVWRTDTLLGLFGRQAVSTYRSGVGMAGAAAGAGSTHCTFDGDVQSFFEADALSTSATSYSQTRTMSNVPAHLQPILSSGFDHQIFHPTLPSTHGHWICGGRSGQTTEFRLFAPPPHAEDVVNWIRLLNLIWKFTRDEPAAARRRSSITPALSAFTTLELFNMEMNRTIPVDLFQWMQRQTSYHGSAQH